MQSHNTCMCVVFSNVSFHMSSQIACLNRCKVTRVASCAGLQDFFLAKSVFLKIWMFDFYALKVCTKESTCCYFQGFSVTPLSLFIKWFWPNYFSFFFSLIYQSTQAFSTSEIHRSWSEIKIFQLRWPKSTRSILMSRKITNTMWLFFQQTFLVKNPHDGSGRKEAFCFCRVQLFLQ